MDFKNIIKDQIVLKATDIAYLIKEFIYASGFEEFYIAGGCFKKKINDFDLYPSKPIDYYEELIKSRLSNYIVFESPNAYTFNFNNKIIQFCKYAKTDLESLINSFDFSHTQIGAYIQVDNLDREINSFHVEIKDVYCTEEYIKTLMNGKGEYTGSDYPLSSLFRVFKYKDEFFEKNYKKTVIKILCDIVGRGFESYDDFKDQLDAIDLAYFEESTEMLKLYNLLYKGKRVENNEF